jgi:hypothetical protein
MKRFSAVSLSAVFLFGAFALPGKVCPSAHGRPATRAAEADVPPCHRAAKPSATPCDKMVCCLVPEAERSAVAAPALPAPIAVWTGVRVALSVPAPTTDRVASIDLFHPPPGLSAGFRLAFSLRAPPVPA